VLNKTRLKDLFLKRERFRAGQMDGVLNQAEGDLLASVSWGQNERSFCSHPQLLYVTHSTWLYCARGGSNEPTPQGRATPRAGREQTRQRRRWTGS
jgi:hypothetical protein